MLQACSHITVHEYGRIVGNGKGATSESNSQTRCGSVRKVRTCWEHVIREVLWACLVLGYSVGRRGSALALLVSSYGQAECSLQQMDFVHSTAAATSVLDREPGSPELKAVCRSSPSPHCTPASGSISQEPSTPQHASGRLGSFFRPFCMT